MTTHTNPLPIITEAQLQAGMAAARRERSAAFFATFSLIRTWAEKLTDTIKARWHHRHAGMSLNHS